MTSVKECKSVDPLMDGEALGRIYVPGRVTWRAVLGCGLLIMALKVALATVGFSRTLRGVEVITKQRARPGRKDTDLIDRVAQAVATAAALYPGRARCLEQSLALYFCLRWLEVPIELRLGVQPYPFEAHSWVEHNGVPVYEDQELIKRFLPLPLVSQ